jgi:hypothetical protein
MSNEGDWKGINLRNVRHVLGSTAQISELADRPDAKGFASKARLKRQVA